MTTSQAKNPWLKTGHPLVFFAKTNNSMIPLTGSFSGPFGKKVQVLTDSVRHDEPVEFTIQNGFAHTENSATPGYAGFYGVGFTFGMQTPYYQFDFSSTMRVINTQFYTCKGVAGVNDTMTIFSYTALFPSCSKADIYLWPYDRKTRMPMLDGLL